MVLRHIINNLLPFSLYNTLIDGTFSPMSTAIKPIYWPQIKYITHKQYRNYKDTSDRTVPTHIPTKIKCNNCNSIAQPQSFKEIFYTSKYTNMSYMVKEMIMALEPHSGALNLHESIAILLNIKFFDVGSVRLY